MKRLIICIALVFATAPSALTEGIKGPIVNVGMDVACYKFYVTTNGPPPDTSGCVSYGDPGTLYDGSSNTSYSLTWGTPANPELFGGDSVGISSPLGAPNTMISVRISADGVPTNGPTDVNDPGDSQPSGGGPPGPPPGPPPPPPPPCPGAGDAGQGCGCASMPVWRVSEPYINLWLHDEPLEYQPAAGGRISFHLGFKQREVVSGFNTNWFSTGKKWNFSWFSYVAIDPATGSNVVHYADGRHRVFLSTIDYLSNGQLSGNTNSGFTLSYPDGSQDIYAFVVTNTSGEFEEAFLSQKLTAQGQQTLLHYAPYTPGVSPAIQLINVVDGDGRTNLIFYTNNLYSTNLITRIVDAFQRTCYLSYDNNGHLTNITDTGGLSSSMGYDTNDWPTNLVTPYGTNTFQLIDFNSAALTQCSRSVLVTQPDGSQHLYLYTNNAPGIADSYSQFPLTTPFTNNFDNTNLNLWDTFHWGPMQYANLSTTNIWGFAASDYTLARMKHWLLGTNQLLGDTISLQRDPSLDSAGLIAGEITWYDYAGKTNIEYEGSQVSPLFIAKVLPDGTTWFERNDRNALGNVVTNTTTYTASGAVAVRANIYTYDSSGIDIIAVTNALNVQTSSNVYNSYNEVTTNYDALNQMTVYTYNANQQVTSITLPTGLIITNIYGANNLLATNYSYAAAGSGTAYFGTNIYSYTNDLILTQTDARGLTTSNTWDNLQRLVRVGYSVDSTFITNTYANLDLVQTVDRMGFTNTSAFDRLRRLTNRVDARGNPLRYIYCSCGALDHTVDALGNTNRFSYNNAGWLTSILYPDGYSVTKNYDLLHRLTNVVDSAGRSTTNWFNNQGLVVAVSNAMGQVQATAFDILDRTTNSTDANGVMINALYDNLNRVLTNNYRDMGVERFGYSARGLIAYTNQLTNITYYGYDAALRKTAETNGNQEVTQFSYSPAGDLLTLTDGKIQTTTWNYDVFGRQTNKLDAASNVITTNSYDADNRMISRWTAAKGITSYYYDNVGNLTNIAYPVSPSISMAYDALNRMTNMIDAVGTNSYTYDGVGQLLSAGGLWPNDTVSYTYNNRLRSSLGLQQPDADPWAQTYGYDGTKRLTNTVSPAGSFGYAYDATAQMQVRKLTLPNGSYITNDYDSMARLLDTWLKNSSNSNLDVYSYAYNVGSQRTSVTRVNGDYVDYVYDSIGQLTNATGKEYGGATNRLLEQLAYGYDAAHNLNYRTNNALLEAFVVNNLNELTKVTNSGTLTVEGTTGARATNVTVNGNNAALYEDNTFAKAGFTVTNGNNSFTAIASDALGRWSTNTVSVYLPATNSYTYDLNGNLLSDRTRTFNYDDENQMISVIVSNGIATPTLTTNIYDGKFRRRIRKEYVWQYNSWIQTNEVHYIYDGNVSIQERDINNLPTATYTRGNDLSGSIQDAGGIGGLLARWDRTTKQTAFYHSDGNGNVTAMINTQQFTVAKYLYDPFGNTISMSGSLANINLYRFSSKEYDQDSGLVYYLYRFYDPTLQRWINRDPVIEQNIANLYLFVEDDAVNAIDPLGLLCADVKSGRGTITGGLRTAWKHHPLFYHTSSPPVTDTFTLTCPSSSPYLTAWGLATSGRLSPFSRDLFPSDWGTTPNSPSGGPGMYTIVIQVPSSLVYSGRLFVVNDLFVTGCCTCNPHKNILRIDPPAPPE